MLVIPEKSIGIVAIGALETSCDSKTFRLAGRLASLVVVSQISAVFRPGGQFSVNQS